MIEADIDPRFAAAHYMDGRDLKQPMPCPWISDLDDVFSERGRETVARIRQVCQCAECASKRQEHTP